MWALGQDSALTNETLPGMELAEDRCSRSWGRVTLAAEGQVPGLGRGRGGQWQR